MLFDGLLMLDPCVYFAISSLSARVRSLGKIYATFSRLREFALHFPTNLVCTKKGRPPGGGLLLEILDGGVPSDSLNPDPISDQKNFQTWPLQSIPVIRPGLQEVVSC